MEICSDGSFNVYELIEAIFLEMVSSLMGDLGY